MARLSVYQKGWEGSQLSLLCAALSVLHSPKTTCSSRLPSQTAQSCHGVLPLLPGSVPSPLHMRLPLLGTHLGHEQDVTLAMLGLAEIPRCIPW